MRFFITINSDKLKPIPVVLSGNKNTESQPVGRAQYRTFGIIVGLILLWLTCWSGVLQAMCISLIDGPVSIDVEQCVPTNPPRDWKTDQDLSFINGLSASEKNKFLQSYRGFLVKAKVAQSQAVRKGLDERKGALYGQVKLFFLPQTTNGQNCSSLINNRVEGVLKESCCDGSAQTPCLYRTSLLLTQAKLIPRKELASEQSKNNTLKLSEAYRKAQPLIKKKKYTQAIKILEEAWKKKQLGLYGQYQLAVLYRHQDRCGQAIHVLRPIYKEYLNKKLDLGYEKLVRNSNFLLARCLAMQQKPDQAVAILQEYLANPQKFRLEITRSLRHKDFRWIHASYEYRAYRKSAIKALKGRS